ncbi:MAG: hypothetical protein ACREPV_06400 [Lysobacter sp.]
MSLIRRVIVALLPVAALAAVIAAVVLLGGCERTPSPGSAPAATEPAQALQQLVDDLHRNDLAAYAHHALPPALHARMSTAWTEGRTIWPLTELPLDDRLPAFITALAAPGSEKALLAAYNRQFAGAERELRSAAATLGLFATQYVSGAGEYSEAERAHYTQLIAALSQWGRQAPLGDPAKARVAVPRLVAAARLTGLAGGLETFHATGMERSLARLGPFFVRFKQVLREYGLDLDQTLAGAQATLVEQTDDRARVSLDYTLGGQPVSAVVHLERHDGRWYLTDLLRHARAAAGPVAPGGDSAPPPVEPPALTAQ